MIAIERPVRFEDVDAAGIVFFARFLGYCHEAMEAFFGGIEGGYVDLITRRKIGFPAVHVEADFTAPLRFGDVAIIDVTIARVGTSSARFRYALRRKKDGAKVALIEHVVVSTDLTTMVKLPLPDDCKALLAAHTVAGTA